jgi:hypothetical protein
LAYLEAKADARATAQAKADPPPAAKDDKGWVRMIGAMKDHKGRVRMNGAAKADQG